MGAQWFATHAAGFGPLVRKLALRDLPGCGALPDGDNALKALRLRPALRAPSDRRSLFRVLGEVGGGLERGARVLAADPRTARALEGRHAGERGPRAFVLRGFGPDDPASIPIEV